MPQHCCVPGCKKKVKEEDGVKISFHKFPEDRKLFRKWIVAIRRDVGKEFRVTDHTRVCSRRFKSSDYLTSLTGREKSLKPTAVPSIFFLEARLSGKEEVPEEKKSCKAKNRGKGVGNKYREQGKYKHQFHVGTPDSLCYKRKDRQNVRCAGSRR